MLAAAVALGAAGCAGCAPASRRTPDDTLVVVIESAITTADPRYAISSWDSKLSRLVAGGLMAVDCDLAQNQDANLFLISQAWTVV